ncbi:MDMPI N domain containing protein [Kitasatospora sp. NBC_01539]|uniref:MDMPI N domain containing protein n=1 Tax=Kitasatospora sp. NBC_01539 TaxID=2903577 RepID=UPI0038601623
MTPAQRHEALCPRLVTWAAGAWPHEETAGLLRHLAECPECAEDAARLSGAAAEHTTGDPLDLPAALRLQVVDWCLARRPAALPVPPWAGPYAAESARLDALIRDLGPDEWQEVAELPWHGGVQRWRPAEVLCHLTAVDSYLSTAVGLTDPLTPTRGGAAHRPAGVLDRTLALITAAGGDDPDTVRARWRGQSHALLEGATRGSSDGSAPVDYGFAVLPLQDAFLDRAFECWIHGGDIARAVDYPYPPPAPQHLRRLVDLGARSLPALMAAQRRAPGPAPGGPGRTLRLVIDGPAGGQWLIPLDGTEGPEGSGEPVAEMALDSLEFCYLAAAHRDPDRVPVGEGGDREAIRRVLHALPLLSRP